MKSLKKYSSLSYLWILTLLFTSCFESAKDKNAPSIKYTCSMHPQVIKNAPGLCPICNMDLVKINEKNNEQQVLTLSESQIQLANIKTLTIDFQNFENEKRLNGRVINNPENTIIIASKFSGRIDQLYFKEAGVKIQKGQALYKIYSEELLSLQKEYLLQINQLTAFPDEKIYKALKESIVNKLKLYGYSNKQILQLESVKKTNPYIIVNAPKSGIITEINITNGDYISKGTALLKLENHSKLWVQADVYSDEIKQLKIGSLIKIEVIGFQDRPINAKIEFLNPQFNEGTQTINLRASIINIDDKLIPGMQANIILPYAQQKGMMVLPIDAVLRDEKGAHIWVKTNDKHFELRIVDIAYENENSIIIKNGIQRGDEVVVSGAYLLMSEYKLKKGYNTMADMKM